MKERIRQLRKHLHMTQVEMSEVLGLSKGFISLVETGRSGLSVANVEKICKMFHVSAIWLMDGSGTMLSDDPASWTVWGENEEEKKNAVADRIREVRKMFKLTQEAFAESIGVSPGLVAMVEQRRKVASEALLGKIEKTYGISRKWLRDGSGEMMPPSDKEIMAEEENRIILEFLGTQPELRSALAKVISCRYAHK